MDDSFLPPYFRRLRRLYSCELQLMSFLPELQARTGSRHLAEQIGGLIHLCRERRNMLELLALEHQFSAAGDECSEMSGLIRKERRGFADESATLMQNDFVSDISDALHCKLIEDYSLARSFASKLKLKRDVERLDEVLDRMMEDFSGLWTRLEMQPFEAVA